MSNAKEIKRKIGSIKNTAKITKAMELISTVKMKKAQDLALSKKDFVIEMMKIFWRVENFLTELPYFQKYDNNRTLAIMVASNKGLCWGYNINVMKKVSEYVKENSGEEIDYITLWKKATMFVVRTWNNLIADFSPEFTDNIDTRFVKRLTEFLYEHFTSWKYKKIVIFYSHYVNSIKQVTVSRDFLPIDKTAIKSYLTSIIDDESIIQEIETDITDYIIEPSIETIASEVIPMILDMMVYDMLLEAKASEHSARMVAMKAAKDNAWKIASQLTLAYNKARQAMITKEVSEIVSWVESLKD